MTKANDLKNYLIPYLDEIAEKRGRKYICPLCGSGAGNNGHNTPAFNIIPNTDETQWKCHACGATGDVLDLDRMRHGDEFKDAVKRLQEKYAVSSYVPKKRETRTEAPEQVDYTDFFHKANNRLSECDYLTKRGICEQLQNTFHIGYVPDWKHPNVPKAPASPRIIIPTSKYSYLARDTRQALTDKQKQYSKQKVGKMHILNADGLYRETEYCFVVEGEIDCLSVLQCGFNCIGLGSANVMESKLLPMCRERKPDLILIFALDNDEAGRLWEQKITEFQKLGIRCTCASVCGTCKDPNELLVKDPQQLTENLQKAVEDALHGGAVHALPEQREQVELRENRMLRRAEKAGHEVQNGLPPYIYTEVKKDGSTKYLVSAPLLAEFIRQNSRYIFVRDAAIDAVRRYWYQDGVYRLISDEVLKGYIKRHITDFDISILKMRDVNEVFQDLITDCSFVSEEELNRAETLINFRNGLLNLETLELLPHTPEVLSTIQLPCDWNPKSMLVHNGAPVFTRFLQTLTDGNAEKQQLLLEYMGACLSNVSGYRFKKALFLVGPGNTGKSQLKALTERLLGSGNSAAIDLAELEKRFGTSKLYGKRLAGSSDMGYVSVNELRIFKQLTGGDSIFSEFKGKPAFEYTYRGLLWFCTNELPKFGGDRGEWVYDRILTFKCSHVIPPEEQDKFLLDKMFQEREAVVYWALLAFRQAYQNGCRFTIPQESRGLLEEYKKLNSPVIQFYEECCMDRPAGKTDKCTTKKLHDVFKAWCRDNSGGGYCCTPQKFREELSAFLKVPESQLTKKVQGQHYYSFTLTAQAKQNYQEIYGQDTMT